VNPTLPHPALPFLMFVPFICILKHKNRDNIDIGSSEWAWSNSKYGRKHDKFRYVNIPKKPPIKGTEKKNHACNKIQKHKKQAFLMTLLTNLFRTEGTGVIINIKKSFLAKKSYIFL
jgi:hypothetical protein